MRLFKSFFLMALCAATLAGCGIKPKELQPPEKPEGAPATVFPRTYPDPTL